MRQSTSHPEPNTVELSGVKRCQRPPKSVPKESHLRSDIAITVGRTRERNKNLGSSKPHGMRANENWELRRVNRKPIYLEVSRSALK